MAYTAKKMVTARIQSKGGTGTLQKYEYAQHADPSKALKQLWGEKEQLAITGIAKSRRSRLLFSVWV